MNSPELDPRLAARRRGQARLRAVTATVGAAGLAGAGVVAFALPGPAHTSSIAASGGAGSSGTSGTSSASGSSGSSSNSGSSSSSGSGISSAQGSGSQTTSGGS
jgi:hypothetical protein